MSKKGTTAKKSKAKPVDESTEQKIKEAARVVFMKKGYAAARTRDIAEQAGINLALLNYYFRSKEKLFDLIMMENMKQFMQGVREVLMREDTSLRQKTEQVASNYIDLLITQPDLPLFILSEIRSNPGKLVEKMGVKEFLFKSPYFKQLTTHLKASKIDVNPIHYFLNTLALIVFPFVGSRLIKNLADLKDDDFARLMQQRKKLIDHWVDAMMKAT